MSGSVILPKNVSIDSISAGKVKTLGNGVTKMAYLTLNEDNFILQLPEMSSPFGMSIPILKLLEHCSVTLLNIQKIKQLVKLLINGHQLLKLHCLKEMENSVSKHMIRKKIQ